MDNSRRFPLILSSFWLKIIALLTMTIDHIGYLLPFSPLALVFRYIGRLSLPLFCFMIFEGSIHSKNFPKYILRLGIMAIMISIAVLCSEIIPFFKNNGFSMRNEGIIFIDLLLGAVAVRLLNNQKWYLKLLALLPLLYGVASFVAECLENCGCFGKVLWFPFFLRTQYGFFAILLCVGFYCAATIASFFVRYHSSLTGIDLNIYEDSDLKRHIVNLLSFFFLAIISIVYYLIGKWLPYEYVSWDINMQLFAIISGAFILQYNGRRGYNGKWFQYGSYLYYPLHMIVLYLIFMFI